MRGNGIIPLRFGLLLGNTVVPLLSAVFSVIALHKMGRGRLIFYCLSMSSLHVDYQELCHKAAEIQKNSV